MPLRGLWSTWNDCKLCKIPKTSEQLRAFQIIKNGKMPQSKLSRNAWLPPKTNLAEKSHKEEKKRPQLSQQNLLPEMPK